MRLLGLRCIPLFPLTFQVLLPTRLIGSLDARDNDELLNIALQRYKERKAVERQRGSEAREEWFGPVGG